LIPYKKRLRGYENVGIIEGEIKKRNLI